MDKSILVLRVFGLYFHFYLNSIRTFCKQTVKNLIRASGLVVHSLPMSHKKDTSLVWVNYTKCMLGVLILMGIVHGRIKRGGQGVRTPPLKNHINKGFLCNTGPDPLKNHKATKPAFNVEPSSARKPN